MCGIAGYLRPGSPPEITTLQRMGRALAHRGPDEEGFRIVGPCGLAHRRLSVIDLSPAAAQPMTNEDGSVWVVFNGEIYGYATLQTELENRGHRFASHSDTEVLVHGYEEFGTALFEKLRGMFALALWEAPRQRLILARDRLGKKPLFYAEVKGGLAFGSELPVFKTIPGLNLSISHDAFARYVEFGYVPGSDTILEQVRKLPPGHFAIWEQGTLKIQAYWQPPLNLPDKRSLPPNEMTARLEETLRDAVACRLESDVPLGCFLSGGIDSSLVAALAQQALDHPLNTYTVSMKDTPMDEAAHAARIARHLGTDHHELALDIHTVPDEFAAIHARCPEPLGDDSFLPTFLISRETRRHVTVVLSGDGGDEFFGGYTKYRQFLGVRRWQGGAPWLWPLLARAPLSDRWRKSFSALACRGDLALARWLSSVWKQDELSSLLAHPRAGTDDFFTTTWRKRDGFPALEHFMWQDVETYLEGDILPKVDRASMAVGLEVRSPLLDQRVIAESLQHPAHPGKEALKKVLGKFVPRELWERPKHGFGLPIEAWYRRPLRPLLLEYTSRARTERRGLLRPEILSGYVNEHLSGRRNFARKLHAIVAFEIWADSFFE